jgi:hypothetical protein
MYTFIYSSKKKKKFITIFICLCNTDDKSYLLSPSISTIKKDSWNSITFINLLAKIAQKKKEIECDFLFINSFNLFFFLFIDQSNKTNQEYALGLYLIKPSYSIHNGNDYSLILKIKISITK